MLVFFSSFFFNDTATTEIYTLSLHDALPISVIERYLKRWEINGAQLVITRNDSLLYARGFGMADKERGIRMEPNMLMRFASVSKLITAVGIMKLQEMKKLKLNEKVFGEKGILRDTVYNNRDRKSVV